jgi:hypothetical protein
MKRIAHFVAVIVTCQSAVIAQVGKDPFAKKTAPPVSSASAKAEIGTLMFTFETWALPPQELDRLVAASIDGVELRENLVRLEREGRARFQWVGALPTRSGQRAKTGSVDQLWYLEPQPSDAEAMAVRSRDCGDTVEIDPVISPDGSRVDLNVAIEDAVFAGFRDAGKNLVPPVLPVAETGSLRLGSELDMDRPVMIGTYSQDREGEVESCVVLARGRIVQRIPQPGEADAGDGGPPEWQLVYRVYALDRASARELLHETIDGDELSSRLKELVVMGSAKVERMMVIKTRSGQRAQGVGESEDAFRSPGITAQKRPGFENVLLGWHVELDPVIFAGGEWVSVNYAVEEFTFGGVLSGDPALDEVPPTPIYERSALTTNLVLPFGHAALAGTLNRPRASGVGGRGDDGETRLVMVEAQVE